MSNADSSESPLEATIGVAGSDATDAFKLLGDETRLAILLALWEAYDPHTDDQGVPFSDLRERVGVRDSGQFNYHLGKLEGRFVRRTDEGYRLLPVGLKLVQTVIADTDTEATLAPTELDIPCPLCAAPTVITYEEGWLYLLCTECEGAFPGINEESPDGVLFAEPFPAAALSDRSPEEVFAAGVFQLLQVMTMKIGGLCPRCSGVVDSSVHVCDAHDPAPGNVCSTCGNTAEVRVRWVCTGCKYTGSSSPAGIVGLHPAVIAFYHDHGVDMGYTINDFDRSKRVLELIQDHEQQLVSTDPLRIRVTVRYDSDQLRLLLDEELNVIEVSEGE